MITTQAILKHKYDSPSGNVSYLLFQAQESFSFNEGQFMMLETSIGGGVKKKPYSIATTNRMLQEEKIIGFIVKRVSEEGMSDFLTQKIHIGDSITMKGALGHYVDPKTHTNYLLISTGSGLSPNIGLFHHLVYEKKHTGAIIHLFGERYSKELIPEINALLKNHTLTNVEHQLYLSQEAPTNDHKGGHVQAGLTDAIKKLGVQSSCFVCGSPTMVNDVVLQLQALGVAREDIIIEKY